MWKAWRSFATKTRYRLLFPGLEIGSGVTFESGVFINVLNGATLTIGDNVFLDSHSYVVEGQA